MNRKLTFGVLCWIAYALPCLGLLAWCAAGHAASERCYLVLWIYGFPSTALLLPVIGLFWDLAGSAEFFVTMALSAIVNGALIYFLLRLVQEALRGESETAGSGEPQV